MLGDVDLLRRPQPRLGAASAEQAATDLLGAGPSAREAAA